MKTDLPASVLRTEPHYSASALAGLPGMPARPGEVSRLMKRLGIKGRTRAGRGGGKEWPLSALPLATRTALAMRTAERAESTALPVSPITIPPQAAPVTQVAATPPALIEAPARATEKQILIRDARARCLRRISELAAGAPMSWKKAAHALNAALAAGELTPSFTLQYAIANDRNGFKWHVARSADGHPAVEPLQGNGAVQATNLSTLLRWKGLLAKGGLNALIPKHKERDGAPPRWAGAFLAIMQRPQKPAIAAAVAELCRNLPADLAAPKLSTVQHWYAKKYSARDKARGRNTGSALNPHKFYHRRSAAGMLPLDEVHSDGWGTHFTAPHPISGKFVKLEVWHTHDVATRYVYPPSIGQSETTAVILRSIASVMAIDGVPAVWQTDNTGAVKNDRVEFDPAASIAVRAGFEIVHNLPGNSQANGIAEEFGNYLDSRSRALATYQGKDMDALTGKRVLKITQKMVAAASREEQLKLKSEAERVGKGIVFESYAQAVDWLNQIFAEYNDRPHRALPKINDADGARRNMTPAEMRARFIEQGLWQPQPLSLEPLRDLMHPHERKKVIRGSVSLYGQRYHHRELEHHNGEHVLVAYDINDGARVWVKALDGALICEAAFVEARGYRPMSFYERALEKRADAQQKRLQNRIDDIDAQRPGAVIEQRLPAKLELVAGTAVPATKALTDDRGCPMHDDFAYMDWLESNRDKMDDGDWEYFALRAQEIPTIDREFRRRFVPPEPAGAEGAQP